MKKLLLTIVTSLVAFGALAQSSSYPDRQIRIISPFATGGIADTFSRVIAQGLNENLGQQLLLKIKLVVGVILAQIL